MFHNVVDRIEYALEQRWLNMFHNIVE